MTDEARRPRQRHLDLANRVLEVAAEDGLTAGDRLPEQLLASRCNVSRTPVRKALQILEERGLARTDAEGGYRLAVDPAAGPGADEALPGGDEGELAEAVLRDLAARRIDEVQTVAALQRRYGQSRQTVLNALQRLLEDQLVERAPGQRWILKATALGPEAQAESLAFRMILEPAALLSPGFAADPSALAALRQATERLIASDVGDFDVALFERLDRDLHALIARSCGNAFVAEALLAHHRRRRIGMPASGVNVYRLIESAREHLQILVEMERGDLELAADLLRVHLRRSRVERPRMLGRGVPPPLRVVAGRGPR